MTSCARSVAASAPPFDRDDDDDDVRLRGLVTRKDDEALERTKHKAEREEVTRQTMIRTTATTTRLVFCCVPLSLSLSLN